ncbi:glycosyltransferase [uncultured Acetobacteroides sp.]|uniref:glycosyltransferase n=1 Tax=uncultured Acetobacteroides sp. TaxID=1760811 RepID=UPI0029F46160|nr:glycosyltransferase [uncultured Acetobacteroides sp.]
MNKRKIIVFHPALAPYRIDFFNDLYKEFDAEIFFLKNNLHSQKFDSNKLLCQLNFKPKYITTGFELKHKNRIIRFGYLYKIIKFKPKIILCWEFNPITIIILLFAKLFLCNTKVYTMCDDSLDVAINCSTFRSLARTICIKYLDGIIFGNDAAKNWYITNYNNIRAVVFPIIQKEERIFEIIKNTDYTSNVYINKFDLKDKDVLLFVGRLVDVKNLNFLIEVFSDYVLLNKNARLILVGDGDKKNELKNLVLNLNIQDYVLFTGRYENEELYAWYKIADYFILPSTSETFGAVVNEALIAGLPVLCSNLAGASCLITSDNGICFDPFNKKDLLNIFKYNIKKRNKLTVNNSKMPYSYHEKITELICFLKE